MVVSVRKIIRISTLIVLVVIFVFAGLSFLTVKLAREAQHRVSHTQTIISKANELLASMLVAETSERGYRITDDEKYLVPYTQALAAVTQHVTRLQALTAQKPAQQERLDQIEALIKNKKAIMKNAVDKHRQGHPFPKLDQGVMNQFRENMDLFVKEEQKIFQTRSSEMDKRVDLIMLCFSFFAFFTLAGVILTATKTEMIERRLQTAEEMAKQAQKLESIGLLTGGVAHDFNNILQVVITNLDLALRKLGPNQPESTFIKSAMEGLEKGANLTAQLLAFARRQPLRPEPITVDRHLRDAVAFLHRTLGEKYQVEFIGSEGLWRALIDPHLLQNAILNLALNARDAMPEGGKLILEAANVTIDAQYAEKEREVSPGQYVMVAVSDTGSGMPSEVVAKAFEPFFSTKAEGTGLGLPMVYGFIKQSKGHVKIYSEPGHGTTIKMYLPRTTMEEEAQATSRDIEYRGDGKTILVVEDDNSVRAGVVAQLSDLGYKVVATNDGMSALDIIRKDPDIDILFTDVVLAGELNGRRLVDRAKKIRPELPVVYTSGYTENAIIHNGHLDEGTILLSKPYRTTDLARVLAGALAGRIEAPKPDLFSPANEGTPSATLSPRTILVVDDDEMVRPNLVMVLEKLSHHVLEAASATEALAILSRNTDIDLLISDLGLPDMNGLKLAEAARKRAPTLGIIIASGTPLLREEVEKLSGPPVCWLLKPFTIDQLRTTIELNLSA